MIYSDFETIFVALRVIESMKSNSILNETHCPLFCLNIVDFDFETTSKMVDNGQRLVLCLILAIIVNGAKIKDLLDLKRLNKLQITALIMR